MKTKRPLLIGVPLALLLLAGLMNACKPEQQEPVAIKILSINNSLIDWHNQPVMFNALSDSARVEAVWKKQTRLGKDLQYHYDESDEVMDEGLLTAKHRVVAEPWTHIILQEQSAKPIHDPDEFLRSVRLWVDYIRVCCPNPSVEIYVTQNWPYVDSSDFDADMQALRESYQKVASATGVKILPVAEAYRVIREMDGEERLAELYADNRHPTPLASYLSACVIHFSLFGCPDSPIAYFPDGVSDADAFRMQLRACEALEQQPIEQSLYD